MQNINTEPREGSHLPKEAAERQAIKNSMEESVLLQKEAADLQEAMGRAVGGQAPVLFEGPGVRSDPEKAHALYAAQRGMLLLKVRVFLKTMRELEQKSMLLGQRMEALEKVLRCTEDAGRAVCEGLQSPAGDGAVCEGPRSPAGEGGAEEFRSPVADRAVSERLRSLSVSRALLLQLQAEAGSLAAVYAELESALVEVGRAADQAAQIRLSEAAAEARRTIERAGSDKTQSGRG